MCVYYILSFINICNIFMWNIVFNFRYACNYKIKTILFWQTEYARFENGRFVYKINRSPMCEYMINFIHKLKHLPEKYMMNSVLENFTILLVGPTIPCLCKCTCVHMTVYLESNVLLCCRLLKASIPALFCRWWRTGKLKRPYCV